MRAVFGTKPDCQVMCPLNVALLSAERGKSFVPELKNHTGPILSCDDPADIFPPMHPSWKLGEKSLWS